jgi:hypothetical protein
VSSLTNSRLNGAVTPCRGVLTGTPANGGLRDFRVLGDYQRRLSELTIMTICVSSARGGVELAAVVAPANSPYRAYVVQIGACYARCA